MYKFQLTKDDAIAERDRLYRLRRLPGWPGVRVVEMVECPECGLWSVLVLNTWGAWDYDRRSCHCEALKPVADAAMAKWDSMGERVG